jgi:TPR repeat protein
LYRLAAEQGDAVAQYDLGQRYDLGLGVPMDRVEALKWLTLAAAQGQTDAAARRDRIKSKMSRQEISEARSRAASFSTNRP